MPLLNVVKIGDTYHYEEFDPKEWTRFPDLRQVSEQELKTIRRLKEEAADYQHLLADIHGRPEVDAEKHAQ
jgi:hypothetical protein